jgi:sphinganine-1-phosphate aldolase
MGHAGYLDSCKQIVGAARKIEAGVRDIEGLTVLGEPKVTVVAFKSDLYDTYEIGDQMSEKGWHCEVEKLYSRFAVSDLFAVNALQNPPSLHICCTRLTIPIVDNFLQDLREAVETVKTKPAGESEGTMVQIYGLGKSSVSGPFLVNEFAKLYLDVLYDV